MTTIWRCVGDYGESPHVLRVFEPKDDAWLETLAHAYRELRIATDVDLASVSLDGIEILDAAGLKERLVAAAVPRRRGGNFDVARSDIAEVALGMLMSEEYGSLYGYRSTRDRELVRLPGRGIDQIGVEIAVDVTADVQGDAVDFARGEEEGPCLILMLGEAKVSSEAASPPRVVDDLEDGLRQQHLGHMADLAATAEKVVTASRRCSDRAARAAFQMADLLLRQQRWDLLRVAATSLLIRPSSKGEQSDFGSFMSSPEDYQPADVRFIIVKLDTDDVEALADEFIELARAQEEGE